MGKMHTGLEDADDDVPRPAGYFADMLRYFRRRLEVLAVDVRLGSAATPGKRVAVSARAGSASTCPTGSPTTRRRTSTGGWPDGVSTPP